MQNNQNSQFKQRTIFLHNYGTDIILPAFINKRVSLFDCNSCHGSTIKGRGRRTMEKLRVPSGRKIWGRNPIVPLKFLAL